MQLLVVSHAVCQTAPEQRLLDRPPFDQLTLKDSADRKTLDVIPLELPQRPPASLPTDGKLTVKLLERPTEEFEISWSSINQLRVYEILLLDEARRLTAAGQFDEAFDYFARLSADYPDLAGLHEAIGDYLRRNALALYQARQHDRALAVLLTLYQRDPMSAGLASAVEKVASEVIEQYLRAGDYAAARSVLELWQGSFRGLATSAAAEWQRRFEAAATKQADEAIRLIQAKQYVAARKVIGKALAIWPQLDAATTLSSQIQREFPFVTVGVLESAPREPQRRIDCWPTIRATRLTQRLLAEEVDFGAEGGVYMSPYGELIVDESGKQLDIKLSAPASGGVYPRRLEPGGSQLTADALARFLLSLAQPTSPYFRPDIRGLLAGVAIGPPDTVQIHLTRLHVRPEAMLRVPPPSSSAAAEFSIADVAPNQITFAAAAPASPDADGLQAVVEQTMADDETAVAALLAGEIDVLDHVPPWQLQRLRAARGIRVEAYRLPTVHVLIPNIRQPLLAKREFRRALCFGIDRRWIVERLMLGGTSATGFEVLSGPFPSGTSLSDPVRYAYNNQIVARPFEPRLAAILATVAWSAVQTTSSEVSEADGEAQPSPVSAEMPRLTLAHPADPVARLACQSIQSQLERQGIPVALKEFTTDELLAGQVQYDLRYAELAVWEPVADARLILGPGSLSEGFESPYLNTALRRLDEATNWNDVRARLAELHEIAHHDLPVIPLWQTINYFAYRAPLRGVGELPVVLYQNVDQWTLAPNGNVARVEQNAP